MKRQLKSSATLGVFTPITSPFEASQPPLSSAGSWEGCWQPDLVFDQEMRKAPPLTLPWAWTNGAITFGGRVRFLFFFLITTGNYSEFKSSLRGLSLLGRRDSFDSVGHISVSRRRLSWPAKHVGIRSDWENKYHQAWKIFGISFQNVKRAASFKYTVHQLCLKVPDWTHFEIFVFHSGLQWSRLSCIIISKTSMKQHI